MLLNTQQLITITYSRNRDIHLINNILYVLDEYQNFIKRKMPETKNEQCTLACIEKKTGLVC